MAWRIKASWSGLKWISIDLRVGRKTRGRQDGRSVDSPCIAPVPVVFMRSSAEARVKPELKSQRRSPEFQYSLFVKEVLEVDMKIGVSESLRGRRLWRCAFRSRTCCRSAECPSVGWRSRRK